MNKLRACMRMTDLSEQSVEIARFNRMVLSSVATIQIDAAVLVLLQWLTKWHLCDLTPNIFCV